MGKIYTSTLVSVNGTTYAVEIWDNATTPTVKTLNLVGEGFSITRQGEGDKLFENPIRSSRAECTYSVTDSTDIEFFQNMAVTDEGLYHMVITKDSNLMWVGRILADQNEWQRTPDDIFTFTVTSVDSLYLLENYELDLNWFDSNGDILVSTLIYRILSSTQMNTYWNTYGASNFFFADALSIYETTLKTYSSERIGKQKISVNAFWKEFATFTIYSNRVGNYNGQLVNCKEALERFLIQFNARMVLENGMFFIYNPLSFGVYSQISYNRYNTLGVASGLGNNYNHAVSISTQNTIRPKWGSFPKITHQSANKSIKINTEKAASKSNVRIGPTGSSAVMTVGPFRSNSFNEIKSEAMIIVNLPSFSTNPSYKSLQLVFRARSYSFDGTNYKIFDHADRLWKPSAGKPGWTQNKIDLPLQYRFGPVTKSYYPYKYEYDYSVGGDYIYTEFEVKINYLAVLRPVINDSINFYGIQRLYQKADYTHEQYFENTNNANASAKDEYELFFYDNYGLNAHGNIMIDDNASGYIPAQEWSAFPTATHTYESDIVSVNGYANMSLYKNAVQSIDGSWYDADDYHVMKSLFFDGSTWTWQGGTFYAQSALFRGEWLRVGTDFQNIIVGGEEDEQEGDLNDQFSQGLVAINENVNVLYDNIQMLGDLMQYNVFFRGTNDSLSLPTADTLYGVNIKYDVALDEIAWNIQEQGKVQSLLNGTHDLDPTAELVVCDSTADAVIINLPDPSTVKGRKYFFKKIASANQVQLNGQIDGLPAYSFNGKDDCKAIMSDGVEYWLVAYYHK